MIKQDPQEFQELQDKDLQDFKDKELSQNELEENLSSTFEEWLEDENIIKEELNVFIQELSPFDMNFSTQSIKSQKDKNLLQMPLLPNLSLADLKFTKTKAGLETRLFELKELWQNEPSWELWRDNNTTSRFVYNLQSSVYYLYKNEDKQGYLSDELSLSLQKNKNNFFISINTPTKYKNFLIKDLRQSGEYFIFKLDETKFIIALSSHSFFTRWWQCELIKEELECLTVSSKQGLSVFSNDTNSYEMRLSEGR